MKAKHPETKKEMIFVEKCLSFGASISCSHFQRFSNALRHIVEKKTRMPMTVTNYLDDFLFIATSARVCNFLMQKFLEICEKLGVPVAAEKTEWSTQRLTFLGIVLDGANHSLTIPEDKRIKAVNMLERMIAKKKATVKELQQLSGTLNFIHKAVVPGRAFTRRMYSKFAGMDGNEAKLKQHHHIKLDEEFKSNAKMWLTFLDINMMAIVARPFTDVNLVEISTELNFFSDASLRADFGFGARFDGNWIFHQWPANFIKGKKPSIEYAELYALCIAVFTWAEKLRNRGAITIFCDNQSVLAMINNTSTGCKNSMFLIRKLVLKTMTCNFRIHAEYIESKKNEVSDALSRLQWFRFRNLQQKLQLNARPDVLPVELWPVDQIWLD